VSSVSNDGQLADVCLAHPSRQRYALPQDEEVRGERSPLTMNLKLANWERGPARRTF